MISSVLVTGATGLLGSEVISRLGSRRVYAAARHAGTAAGGVSWVQHDFRSEQPLELPPDTDAVVHLAQSTRFREFPEGAQDMFDVNLRSTAQLLDASSRAGVRRFVFASTGAVYRPSDNPLREEDELEDPPSSYYVAAKRAAELLVGTYSALIPTTILRFFFVYGRKQREDMLLPRLVSMVSEGRPVLLQGDDGIRLNPIHVSDAAAAVVGALDLTGDHLMNVAGSETVSIRELACAIATALGRVPTFERLDGGSTGNLVADISRMSALLTRPKTPLAEGVRDLCAP
ncbi:MAG: NAD(P)-dependent oxidoreductase [Actinomycetota bacterium]|nr:NAD(P)-dependent oxidoreductase [Actinomycetota bacterium]